MNRKAWLLATASLVTGMAQATCYSVYKADGTLAYQGSKAPVDLSLQIGDTVREKFGSGATMTMSDQATWCRDTRERKLGAKSLAEAVREEESRSAMKVNATASADATKTVTN